MTRAPFRSCVADCRGPPVCLVAASVLATRRGLRAQGRGQAGTAVAGTGTIYVSTYKGIISVIDEATEKVTDEIPVSDRHPGRRDVFGRLVAALRAGRVVREGRDRRPREERRRSARSR